jgi:hypothetical protein
MASRRRFVVRGVPGAARAHRRASPCHRRTGPSRALARCAVQAVHPGLRACRPCNSCRRTSRAAPRSR